MPILEEFRSAVANQIIQYLKIKGGAETLSPKRTLSVSKIQEILAENNDPILLRRALENFITNMNGGFLAIQSFSIFDGSKLRNLISRLLKKAEFSEDNLALQERKEIREMQKNHVMTNNTEDWQKKLADLDRIITTQQKNIETLCNKINLYQKIIEQHEIAHFELAKNKIALENRLTALADESLLAKQIENLELASQAQSSHIQQLLAKEQSLTQDNQKLSDKYSALATHYQQLIATNARQREEIAHLQRQLAKQGHAEESAPVPQEGRKISL